MDFAELVRNVCKHPGMYVTPATLETVMAFLNGFDMARDHGPLVGFREWLVVRNKGGDNFHWTGLVMQVAPGLKERSWDNTDEEHARICAFGVILNEFLTFRDERGLTTIFHDYRKWLLKQQWYTGPLRKKQAE